MPGGTLHRYIFQRLELAEVLAHMNHFKPRRLIGRGESGERSKDSAMSLVDSIMR